MKYNKIKLHKAYCCNKINKKINKIKIKLHKEYCCKINFNLNLILYN